MILCVSGGLLNSSAFCCFLWASQLLTLLLGGQMPDCHVFFSQSRWRVLGRESHFQYVDYLLSSSLSIQFSPSVMSNTLRPHGLQYVRPPCPTPRAHSNSCPLSQWYHPTISSSVIPFSSRLQSLPASGSFPLSHFFTSGGQNIGVSASPSVLPLSLRMDWLDLLAVQGTLKSLLQYHSSKASILRHSTYFINCHIHTWPL